MDRDYTLDDVRDALRYLDESNRDTWVRIGGAIKNEFGDDGFDVWDKWSEGYAKYDKATARTVWKSLKPIGRKKTATLGSVIYEARLAGWQPRDLDDAERTRLAAEVAERRAKAEAQAKAEAEHDAKLADAAAALAERLWLNSSTTGASPYLGTKKVRAHGVGFYNEPVIAEINTETLEFQVVRGWDACKAYLDEANQRGEDDPHSFKFLKRGTIAVPMRDANGNLRNLQFIFQSGKKTFIKGGQKAGTCHVVGVSDVWRMGDELAETVCIAEGYATAASVHEATGLPVVVAWDCGNLRAVGDFLRRLYPDSLLMFCADDDRDTDGNPGVTCAIKAAEAVRGVVVVPEFKEVA